MSRSLKPLFLLALACLFTMTAWAESGDVSKADAGNPPSTVIEKTGAAIEHGAKAAASGIERGAKAAAHGVERGAQATGRALSRASQKIGITKASDN